MSNLKKVEVIDEKGNFVTSYMITSETLAEKLKRHGIGTSVEVDKPNMLCSFCKRNDFKSLTALSVHVRSCAMNPGRMTVASSVCPKCSLKVANRSFDAHVVKCDGNPETLIRRRALRDDILRRKNEARISGKPYETLFTGRRKRNVDYKFTSNGDVVTNVSVAPKNISSVREEVGEVKNQTDNKQTFDSLVAIMAEHCASSMGSKYREFLEWVETSQHLWDSV